MAKVDLINASFSTISESNSSSIFQVIRALKLAAGFSLFYVWIAYSAPSKKLLIWSSLHRIGRSIAGLTNFPDFLREEQVKRDPASKAEEISVINSIKVIQKLTRQFSQAGKLDKVNGKGRGING
jgi:hypothetical protein